MLCLDIEHTGQGMLEMELKGKRRGRPLEIIYECSKSGHGDGWCKRQTSEEEFRRRRKYFFINTL